MRIFFYIFKLFNKLTAGVLTLAVFMFVLSDLAESYGDFFEKYGASGKEIAAYYAYQIPFQIVQILPFAALIGSIATMMLLNKSGEIVAIRAAGLGPYRIAKPIIFGGLLFLVLNFWFSHSVVPSNAVKRNRLVEQIKGGGSKSLLDAKWMKKDGWVYSYANYDLSRKALIGIKAFKIDEKSGRIQQMWEATKAVYDEKTKNWQLNGEFKASFKGKVLERFERISKFNSPLPYEPSKLFKDERLPIEFSYGELLERVRDLKAKGTQYRPYEVELHVKLGYCLAALLLSLLGIKFGFKFERSSAVMKSLFVTLVLGVGYWFVLSSMRALALSSSTLPPWVAGWGANIFLAAVVVLESKRLKKY